MEFWSISTVESHYRYPNFPDITPYRFIGTKCHLYVKSIPTISDLRPKVIEMGTPRLYGISDFIIKCQRSEVGTCSNVTTANVRN